jgi:hypothetical protein
MVKVYGRNPDNPDSKNDSRILQRTLNRLHGHALVPRGLYRFTSFQESNLWMMQQMARTHARRNSKT